MKKYEYNLNDKDKGDNNEKMKIMMKKLSNADNLFKKKKEVVDLDESKINLLNHSLKNMEVSLSPGNKGSISAHRSKTNTNMMDLQEIEVDSDDEFLNLTDLIDMDKTYLDSAVEKFDEIAFDSFTYCQILSTHSLHYICYKIFKMYNFFEQFHIPL